MEGDDESEQDEGSGSGEEDSQEASGSDESGTNTEEVDEDDESDDDSKEWDEYCYLCNDGGNMLCCESCTKVAHASCVNLKNAPKGAWHCKDCTAKLVQKKQASRAAATLANGRTGAKGGGSKDAHMPTRTSARSRRAATRR